MKQFRRMLITGLMALSVSGFAAGANVGSADEAVAMVKRAAAYLKEQGKDKAYAEFNNPAGRFKDRDLYVAVLDANGVTLAHGGNSKVVGKAMIDLKDIDGVYFVRKFLEIGNAKGSGWVDYKWPNPVSKVLEQKTTYVEKVGDVVIICGAYK
ncbi:MAG: cache domain-containing protein [Pseudomonadota bacterium]